VIVLPTAFVTQPVDYDPEKVAGLITGGTVVIAGSALDLDGNDRVFPIVKDGQVMLVKYSIE